MNGHGEYPTTPRVGIIGATGFAGVELASLVDSHPYFVLEALASTSDVGNSLGSYYPNLTNSLAHKKLISIEALQYLALDLVFLAVPHTTALDTVAQLINQGVRVVDLSADYRLKNPELYHDFYGVEHTHPALLSEAVYGLSEVYGEDIAQAQLVANPGCYPTAIALACIPAVAAGLVDPSCNLMVSAISGYSGAGRKACQHHNYSIFDEDVFPYKALVHQHTPEIEQTLAGFSQDNPLNVSFVPQIGSFKRGILANCFLKLHDTVLKKEVSRVMGEAYGGHSFVKVLPEGTLPHISEVTGTNHVRLGWEYDEQSQALYVASALDNLIKGAAGQAVQNANIMFNFSETEGLLSNSEVV